MHAYVTAAHATEIPRNQPVPESAYPCAAEANTLHTKNAAISKNTAAAEQIPNR
ncbi:hypothetical protein GCM10027068_20740 [Prescottella soli]